MKAIDPDVFLYEMKDLDTLLARWIDKPGMGQHFYLPASTNEWFYNHPRQINSYYTTYQPIEASVPQNEISLRNAAGKGLEVVVLMTMVPLIMQFTSFNEMNVHPEIRGELGLWHQPNTKMSFGFGVEGFRDRYQYTEQSSFFFPAVESKSKFSPQFSTQLPQDYLEFIDRFESIVYISFGSIFNPEDE